VLGQRLKRYTRRTTFTIETSFRDEMANVFITRKILRQQNQVMIFLHSQLGAYDSRQVVLLRCMREANHATHIIMIRERQGAQFQFNSPCHQFFRIGSSIQKRECRMAMQLRILHHWRRNL
jgi:hypothetical protein